MNKYKTVKEVCNLTGLTRKHLYYFHHAKVAQAVAYANYSVEGNDGYKLYDDAAVEKLQQIALYYQLGLKRDEIRDIMLDPNYDSNMVLDTLLAIEQSKKATIERYIAALEYLKLTGTKNRPMKSLLGMSLEELGETIINVREATSPKQPFSNVNREQVENFIKEFEVQFAAFQKLNPSELEVQAADEIIKEMVAVSIKYLGEEGIPFVLGCCVSSASLDIALQRVWRSLASAHVKCVIRYFVRHPELYKELSGIPNQNLIKKEATEYD